MVEVSTYNPSLPPSQQQIQAQRRLAQALSRQAARQPRFTHPQQALAPLGQNLAAALAGGRARSMENQRQQSLAQALAGVGRPEAFDEAAWGGLVQHSPEDAMKLALESQAARYQTQQQAAADAAKRQADQDWWHQQQDYLKANRAPTAAVQNYKYGVENPGFVDHQERMRKASANNTNVTVGGEPNDAKLRQELDKRTGELWGGYQEQAGIAGDLTRDLDALDELITLAPQGPLQGRLAEVFPGFSSAGDAFQSIVKRVAPTLRAPGSGSTSDIEYDGMLRSLPALRNKPEANNMIAQIMRSKAGINMERGGIVNSYHNGEITASQAREQLAELNKRSIMTPEMKEAFSVLERGAEEKPKRRTSGGVEWSID